MPRLLEEQKGRHHKLHLHPAIKDVDLCAVDLGRQDGLRELLQTLAGMQLPTA